MTYVDAALAPLRKTGQIKLYGVAAFEGMRRAGRLVAECLDMLAAEVKPGVATERLSLVRRAKSSSERNGASARASSIRRACASDVP